MKAADRCDHCGAQAFIEVVHMRTVHTLMFCAHHYKKFELVLMAQNFRVLADDRSLINKKPSESSPV